MSYRVLRRTDLAEGRTGTPDPRTYQTLRGANRDIVAAHEARVLAHQARVQAALAEMRRARRCDCGGAFYRRTSRVEQCRRCSAKRVANDLLYA